MQAKINGAAFSQAACYVIRQIGNKNLSIRQYILRERPSTKTWSVAQVIDEKPAQFDFFQRYSPLPGAVALDLNNQYRGWRLGFTDLIAIKYA